jgi:hypothetical protein
MADQDTDTKAKAPKPPSAWEVFDYRLEALGKWALMAGTRARLVLQIQNSLAADPNAISEYEIERIELHDGAQLLIDHIIVSGQRYRRAQG